MFISKFIAVVSTVVFTLASVTDSPSYKIGDMVQDFALKNVDEKTVSLKDFPEAKGFIVIFTCNHCPFAKAYEDRIMDLDKKYKPLGYPVIAINPNDPVKVPDDNFEAMQKQAKKKKYSFPYLHDDTQQIAKKFGATRTPHTFILQKQSTGNKLVYIGAIDNNAESASAADVKYVENAVKALLKGESPNPAETKAIGCSIKWKE
jgi:peroxiredoxin